jgi:hypothetical protein
VVDEIRSTDVIHPLAQAGIYLPKPKQPEITDAEGIEGVNSSEERRFF